MGYYIERIGLIRLMGIRANAIRTDSVFKADSALRLIMKSG